MKDNQENPVVVYQNGEDYVKISHIKNLFIKVNKKNKDLVNKLNILGKLIRKISNYDR